MTMPHLQNCPHRCDSWCLDCVKKLGEENMILLLRLHEIKKLTTALNTRVSAIAQEALDS